MEDIGYGAVGGIIATSIYIVASLIFQVVKDRRIFGRWAGDYVGYAYKEGCTVNWDHHVSEVKITHTGKNTLRIELKHDFGRSEGPHEWAGTIVVDRANETVGKTVWEYKSFAESDRKFGFKDCIFNPAKDEIYLIGEEGKGYGVEVLKKRISGQSYERKKLSLPKTVS